MKNYIITKDNIKNTSTYIKEIYDDCFFDKINLIGIKMNSPLSDSDERFDSFTSTLNYISESLAMSHSFYNNFKNIYSITDSDYEINKGKWNKIIFSNSCVFVAIVDYFDIGKESIEIFYDNIKNYGFPKDKEVIIIKSNLLKKNKEFSDLVTYFSEEIYKYISKSGD